MKSLFTGLVLAGQLLFLSCDGAEDGSGSLNLDASQGEFTDKVHLEWDGISGATVYILERNVVDRSFQDEIWTGEKTETDDSTAEQGVQYEYQVTAYGSSIETKKSKKAVGYLKED
jgi:hypothetical protein